MRIISYCYISFVRLRSRILPCSFSGTPRCVDVLKSRARHKVACRACVRIPMYSGNLVNTGHRCDSQKYPSSDVNAIGRNIDYRSKCSSMIYGKTDVQSIAMKADRSSAMVSLNTLQMTISLNIYKNSANKFGRKTGFKIENEIEDHYQSIPKLTGMLTELRCIIGQNLEILTSTGGEWLCGQAQNCVNFDFQVKFDLEEKGQSTPKTMGIWTKLFWMLGSNLVILAGTSDKLSRGQTRDWRPHGQTQATTIPEGQNWPWVKMSSGRSKEASSLSGRLCAYLMRQNLHDRTCPRP